MTVATLGLKETREAIAAKSKRVSDLFADGKGSETFTEDEARELRELNGELDLLATRRDELEVLDEIGQKGRDLNEQYNKPAGTMRHQGGKAADAPAMKSFRQALEESADFKRIQSTGKGEAVMDFPQADFKTLITLTTINNLQSRQAGIQASAQEERTVADLMLQGTTDNNRISYMVETTFTNSAATVAEGGTKPESALAFTETTESVRKIATWIPLTDEALSDVAGLDSYVRGRMVFMVERTEEVQLLTGDGIAPNLLGLLNRVGIQTQAKGADPTFDALYKAITKVRNTGFAEPTGIVMHPNDWQDIVLTRTADGIYILGNPAGEAPARIWGMDVRVTTAETENTALVGAFKPFSQIFRREGITVTISTEHSTYFVENKVALLAEERLALAVYRPAAFCTVTGI